MIKFEDLKPGMVIDTLGENHPSDFVAVLDKDSEKIAAVYLQSGSINNYLDAELWSGLFNRSEQVHPKWFIMAIFENEHVAERLHKNWLLKK